MLTPAASAMRLFSLISVVLLGLAGSACASEPALVGINLVKDLDTRPGSRGSGPGRFKALGGRVYFSAAEVRTGAETYSTDAQGNVRFLGDIAPGARHSAPEPIVVVGDRVIVSADDGTTGLQLWSLPVDGGVPVRLTSLNNLWLSWDGLEQVVTVLGNRAFLVLPGQEYRLLTTDGTPAGTFERTPESGFPLRAANYGCALGETAIVDGFGESAHLLVRTNGLPGGDSVIATLPPAVVPRAAVAAAGQCYFLFSTDTLVSAGWSLWRTDGTAQGSTEIASAQASAGGLAVLGNSVYFLEGTDDNHTRLRRLSAGGDVVDTVVDLPGPLRSNGPLWTHEGYLLFDAFAVGTNGFEAALFVSDGSSGGTRRLYPPPGESGNGIRWYPVPGAIVRKSNSGADLRVDLATGEMTALDSEFFNYADSAGLGGVRIGRGGGASGDAEVWITAGTTGSTRLLHDIWADTRSGVALPWRSGTSAAVGDTLFFSEAYDPTVDGLPPNALWRTDGTESGTRMLPAVFHPGAQPRQVQRYGNDGVLFLTDRNDLYRADVTLNSAALVATSIGGGWLQSVDQGAGAIFPCGGFTALCSLHSANGGGVLAEGNFDSAVRIGEIGGIAVFAPLSGRDIWRSDGTAPGTFRLLTDRYLPDVPSGSQEISLGGKIYFIACLVSSACDLIATDGTVQGTQSLRAIPAGGLRWAGRAGNRLVLGTSASQVWSTDGTAAGTVLLYAGSGKVFASTGRHVHMHMSCAGCKQQYLVTDGTPAGTHFVDLPASLRHSGTFAAALGDDAVVFSCDNQRRGVELCLADSDGESIVPLPEIFPGDQSANPLPLGRTDSAVYFSADDGLHGRELWRLHLLTDAVFADGFD